jgi:tight adherence protein B
MALFVAICIFFAIIIILMALVVLQASAPQREAIKRLDAVMKAEKRGANSLDLQLIRDELLSDVPVFNRLLLRWSWSARLRLFVAQAGGNTKPGKLLLISAVFALVAELVCQQYYGNALISISAAAVSALLPFGFIGLRRSRRLLAFEKNLPDAIDLLGRAVRAGHAFTTGLEMIATELPEPVAGEFRTAFEEQNFGLPLKEALHNLVERVPMVDVRFFVTALMIQKETGGNLGEILDNLAHVIRERFKILGEVRIRTAQGRLTAVILMAIPPMMIALLQFVNPEYIRPLFEDPLGTYMLWGACALQVLGSLILWKIVHIEI